MVDDSILAKEPIVVTTADGIDELLYSIHDERFELDQIEYLKEEGVVNIPYRRIYHLGPRRLLRNWIIWQTYEADVIRAVLTIRNVESFTVEDRSEIGTYCFNTVTLEGDSLTFWACEDCELVVKVSDLHIESTELEIRGKSRISYFLFLIESSSGKVY